MRNYLCIPFVVITVLTPSLVGARQAASGQGVSTPKAAAPAKPKTTVSSPSRTVLISADMECMLKIDDGDGKSLSVDKPLSLKLGSGEHLLIATSSDGKDVWRQVITLDKPGQKVVTIGLLPIKQAREQDEIAKQELEKAQAKELADQAEAAEAKEAQAQQQEKKARDEALRKQSADNTRKQIGDLRSQIADLQQQISDDEDQIQQDEQNIQEAEQTCAEIHLQPGVPCVAEIGENVSRADETTKREEITELKDQIRDLQSQIETLQNQ